MIHAPQLKTTDQVRELYERRIEALQLEIARCTQPLRWLFAARGAGLLASLVLFVVFLLQASWLWGLAAAAMFTGFLVVAVRHESFDRRRQIAQIRCIHDQQSLARLERRWNDLPVPRVEIPSEAVALGKDLDLFGKASLFQWLCIAKTPMGRDTLRDWILAPPPPAEIRERQRAMHELARHLEYVDELQLRSQLLTASKNGPREFVAWAEDARWLESRRWLLHAARGLAVAFCVVLLGWGIGLLDPMLAGISVMGILTANFILTLWFAGRIHDIFNAIAEKQANVVHYQRLFDHAVQVPGDAALLDHWREALRDEQRGAIDALHELGWITQLANLRRAGLFGIVYLILQITLLWDVHWLAALEHWHRRHGHKVRSWFETVGCIEALASLAKLAHDQPEWTLAEFQETDPASFEVSADQLGHPLLKDAQRVCNDVQVGPPGTFLLVTGSNMSGKSTLLRAIGTNVVLAQLGTVTCTQRLSLPWLELATSMRIHDSLAEGVSFYMAELQRLKQVVDLARARADHAGPRLFFLLDEILQGTNSRERHIAVSRVVQHLTESQALGAVSTHDLELAHAPALVDRCRCVHFRESFETVEGQDRMVFDYQMRDGVATTTNALKLLRLVGLDTDTPVLDKASSDSEGSAESLS